MFHTDLLHYLGLSLYHLTMAFGISFAFSDIPAMNEPVCKRAFEAEKNGCLVRNLSVLAAVARVIDTFCLY